MEVIGRPVRWEAGVQATLSLSGLGQAPPLSGDLRPSHLPRCYPVLRRRGPPAAVPHWGAGARSGFPHLLLENFRVFLHQLPRGREDCGESGTHPGGPCRGLALSGQASFPTLSGERSPPVRGAFGAAKGGSQPHGAHAAFVWRCQGLPTVSPRPGLGGWGSQEPSQLGLAPHFMKRVLAGARLLPALPEPGGEGLPGRGCGAGGAWRPAAGHCTQG